MFTIQKKMLDRYPIVLLEDVSKYIPAFNTYSLLQKYGLLEYDKEKGHVPTKKAYVCNVAIHDSINHEDRWFIDKLKYFLLKKGENIV